MRGRCAGISTKIITSSRVFSRISPRFRTPTSRNLGANCSADSAASCADAVLVAQHTRCAPAEFCVGGAPKQNKIYHTLACFFANFCALSNAEVAQSRCQLQRRLGRELRLRCAFCAAQASRAVRVLRGRWHGAPEFQQNLPHLRASSREFLRAFERRSRAMSVPTTTQTRPRSALTSCVLRSTRGARRPSFAWAVLRNQTKFATRSRVFSRILRAFER